VLIDFHLSGEIMATKPQKNLKVKFTNELFNYLFQFHPLPILVYELKSLSIKNVNKAAIQKYGYSKSSFLKLKLTDLSLPELLRKPSQKIPTKNLQKHKTKNGKVIDVQITKSKIVYEGLVCELMIVQDVTEHINLENQLIKPESELSTTLYSIGVGVITTDDKGRVIMMNPVAEILTGWKEKDAKGKKLELVFNIVNEFTRKKVVNPVKKVLQKGIVIGLANHTVLISKDKIERPILDCGAPIKDKSGKIAGVVLVFRDQTKEREAQRKIEEAKIFAESIISTLREPLIVLDSQMNVIKANRAFYNIFKTSEKETIGKSFFKLGNGQWNIPELKLLLENILPSNTSFENFEVQHNFPKIGFKTMLLNARRVYSESNKTEFILLAVEDITERKKAEENIKKLNRIYSMLYETNEAIVRNREKEKLLKLITQIAVDKGGFSLAWISMIDVESNELIIEADYGMNEDYRNKINTDFKIIDHDKCPIRKVLKTGKYYVTNNILKDKKMSLCYDTALEYGFKSFAAFPIKIFGKNIGTFNLYSTEENFFDKEEIELLEQLSMDISFALEYIESENERKKVEEILKRNEEKYYTLIESSDDAIYLVDRDCRYLHMNKRYLIRLGLKLEDVIGKSYSEFHTPDGSKDFEEKVKKVCETGVSITYEYKSFRDGRYFIRTLSPVKDAVTNEVNAVVIISKDITHLKEIEKARRESEEKFRFIAERANDLIYIYRFKPKQGFEYVSPSATRITGYSPEEHYADPMLGFKLVYPDDLPILKSFFENKIITEPIVLRWRKKDGSLIWTEQLNVPIYDENGELVGVQGIARDVTERKRVEESLRESEEKFRKLAESTNTAIFIYKKSKFVYANKATEKLSGYSEHELLQMNFWDVVHPDFRDMIMQRGLDRLSGKEVPAQYDFKIVTKDNQEKWITFTSTVIDYKGETAAIGTAFDIIDRKIAEEKLRESEERFRNIYESLTIGVYRTTPDGKLLMANPAFLSMLGYDSLEEAQAKIVMEEVYAEKGTRDLFLKIIMEEGIVYGFEQKWKRADGKIIYIRENARAYKNIDGSIAYFEGTTEDITTKKLAEQELIIAKEEAEKTDKLKSYFLAQISHEIRTPLNVIVSFCNIIKEEIKDKISPDINEYFNSIDLASKRIVRTVDLILNMSAVQSGTYIPTHRFFNLKEDVIDKLIPEFITLAKIKGLTFLVDYKTDKLNLYADDYSVTQIFSNLIDNAIKYTNKGKVEIIIERNEDDKLTVKVKDTGIGMSEDFLQKIFQPFTQEEQGYTRRFEGSGLGLALVKKYCELNNAEISVESKKGEGSTFTVMFI